MGFDNRDYYREDEGTSSRAMGSELTVTVRIIIICVGLFLLNLFLAGQSLDKNWITYKLFALHGDTFRNPLHWFQYLTYAFAHDPSYIQHLLWTMFALYFFGSEMERLYGKREYLRFYLVTLILGGLCWSFRLAAMVQQANLADSTLKDHLIFGANGPVTALTLLFCMHYPYRSIFIFGVLPVPAWAIGGLTILGNMSAMFSERGLDVDPNIVGVVFAILYFRFQWNLGQLPGMDFINRVPSMFKSLFKPRPNLKVFDSSDDDDAYQELETEADRILDKLHREGEGGLTAQERRLLERYSRLMRQKHR